MKTLIDLHSKLQIANSTDLTNEVPEKLVYSTLEFDYKFYQNLFVILLSLFTFLIFPESPKDSDDLCEKYHTKEACAVW